jgi:tetratricopeptide (TPR) repeat protein
MGRESINILTSLNILFMDMEDESPSALFTDAMRAEMLSLTEDDELLKAEVPASIILGSLNKLFIDFENEEMSVAFTYAALDEMSRLVAILAADEDESPQGLFRAYITMANEYMALSHYEFAYQNYIKAFDVFPACREEVFADEGLSEMFEDACVEILKLCEKMEYSETSGKVVKMIGETVPDRAADIQKRAAKKATIKNDPVEYTSKYLSILPELEKKIEAELKDVRRGHGFCFHYWHTKQDILKRDYGIEWNSPSVLNPRVRFD